MGVRVRVRALSRELPLGDVHFDAGGIKIGFEICEDAWIAKRPGAELSLDAVDVILNPSASHFAFGKKDVRRRLTLEGSRAFGVTYVYANLMGNEAGRAIYDGDALIATGGKLVASAPRFSHRDHAAIEATVDVDLTRSRHGWLSSFTPRVQLEPDECVEFPHEYPSAEPEPTRAPSDGWESSVHSKEEEFTRAVSLGLLDYLRKSRSRGFVVSLSGGADSSAVACLVSLMVRFAVAELGEDGLREKLAHIPALRDCQGTRAITRALLTTVYQSTRNSSETTRNAAREVAEALGARHLELDVDELVERYVKLSEGALGRSLGWETDDIALQNIQARVRAPSV